MADDKVKMPADGGDGSGRDIAESSDPASAGRPDMLDNAGQSGGGAYPHGDDGDGAFRGGQSEPAYFGKGQLGDKHVGETHNAVREEED